MLTEDVNKGQYELENQPGQQSVSRLALGELVAWIVAKDSDLDS